MLFCIVKYLYSISIPIILASETVHFALWNGPFHSLKRSVSQREKAWIVMCWKSDYNRRVTESRAFWINLTFQNVTNSIFVWHIVLFVAVIRVLYVDMGVQINPSLSAADKLVIYNDVWHYSYMLRHTSTVGGGVYPRPRSCKYNFVFVVLGRG